MEKFDIPQYEHEESAQRSAENGISIDKFLKSKDIEVLETGMSKLNDFFSELSDEKMPQTIVFLETSARPLYYFLKPLIENTYARRNLNFPNIRFVMNFAELDKWKGEAIDYETQKENLDELKSDQRKKPDRNLQLQISHITGDLEGQELNLELGLIPSLNSYAYYYEEDMMSRRVERVFEEIDKDELAGDEVLFIDDYINKGGTIKNLDSALDTSEELGAKMGEVKFNLFSFYRNNKSLDYEKDHPSSRFNVISGETGDDYGGFYYRSDGCFSPFKSARYKEEKEAMLGVKKVLGERTVARAPNADYEKMSSLRKTMAELGERILRDKISSVNNDQ